jgi:hypothetical protein
MIMNVIDTAFMSDLPTKWHGRPWWQFVGVLVAVAALVVAIIQLMAAPGDEPPPATAASATPITPTTVPATVATSAAVSVSSAPASGPSEGTTRWQKPVTVQQEFDTSVDLDPVPPRTTTVDEEGDVTASSMLDTYGRVTDYDQSSRVAEWKGDGKPDFAACRERALAGGGDEVDNVRRGTVLCVETDEGNVARLTITEVIKFKGFEADTVVWNANGA